MINNPLLDKKIAIPLLDSIRHLLGCHGSAIRAMQVNEPYDGLPKFCSLSFAFRIDGDFYIIYFHTLFYWGKV